MLIAKTSELELMQGWFASDPEHARVQVAFPINKWAGSEDSAVVYFEVRPGDRLACHTDSAEEILYIVAGEAEAEVGDERGRLTAGDLAVIPAMVPHGLVNVGTETVWLASRDIRSIAVTRARRFDRLRRARRRMAYRPMVMVASP
jgi:quercetin dioxygenase-like cupin family protein